MLWTWEVASGSDRRHVGFRWLPASCWWLYGCGEGAVCQAGHRAEGDPRQVLLPSSTTGCSDIPWHRVPCDVCMFFSHLFQCLNRDAFQRAVHKCQRFLLSSSASVVYLNKTAARTRGVWQQDSQIPMVLGRRPVLWEPCLQEGPGLPPWGRRPQPDS